MGFFNSFTALVWRNLTYRRRRWISSIFEFLLPALVVYLLLFLKSLTVSTGQGLGPTTIPAVIRSDNDVVVPYSFLDYITVLQAEHKCHLVPSKKPTNEPTFTITNIETSGSPVPFIKCDNRKCTKHGEDAKPFCEMNILALVPDHSTNQMAMEQLANFKTYVESRHPQIVKKGAFLHDFPFIQTFDSNSALDQYVTSFDYGTLSNPKVAVAIAFTSTTQKQYDYTIRVNATNYNDFAAPGTPSTTTTPPTDRRFESTATEDNVCDMLLLGPDLGRHGGSCTYQYIYNGALTMQRLVQDWIIQDTGSQDAGYQVSENGVSFVPFPTSPKDMPGFFSLLSAFFTFLLVLGLLFPVATIIRAIVEEKELRQKELMKMMSVPESAIGWSWFVSFFVCFHSLSALLSARFAAGIFEKADPFLLVVFWQFAALNTVIFSFAVAAIFSRSTRAVLVGLLAFFVGFFLTLAVDYTKDSALRVGLVALHPVTAISYGMQVISDLEDSGMGLTMNTLAFSENPSGYSFLNVLASLCFDALFWGFLSWYLNRVIPGDYGQSLPWYFPFTKAYWFPSTAKPFSSDDGETESFIVDTSNTSILEEPVSSALKDQEKDGQNVQLHNLTKHFGNKVAVNSLSLSMYSGQVTALLGHNGAGKTTTISMMTGMLTPTSGYATIAGKDIRTQLSAIREEVGICLQHDCLFPQLTVEEHLQFFLMVKGLYSRNTESEVEAAITSTLEDVALLEKRYTFSKNLSGGMKRKLSVAIAFCGAPKVVFLDEPTSGMDPFSRRFTWNVIRQYRQDRVIVLTTHHMDEADILGDRIAIMAEGQLRCCGSPLFLKRSYGVGYQLTIEKKPNFASDLSSMIQNSVPEAKLLSNVGTEMSFQLPLASSQSFVPMLQKLDGEVDRGSIATYGIGITSLDEVFLMVAKNTSAIELVHGERPLNDSRAEGNEISNGDDPASVSSCHRTAEISDGRLFFRHVQALFRKRAMNFKRDKKAWCCSTIMPSIFSLLGFLFVTRQIAHINMGALTVSLKDQNHDMATPIPFNQPGKYACTPGKCISTGIAPQNHIVNNSETNDQFFVCGGYAAIGGDASPDCSISKSKDFVSRIAQDGQALAVPRKVSNIQESSKDLINTASTSAASQFGALYFTHDQASVLQTGNNGKQNYNEKAVAVCKQRTSNSNYTADDQCEQFNGIGYTVAYNFTAIHSSVLYQALADEAIIRHALDDNAYRITPTIHPLPVTMAEATLKQDSDSFTAWFLLVLSFPFITGAFATFVVTERASKAKHLQTVAGVTPEAYWVSSFLWDIMNYQLPVWIVIIEMLATGIEAYTKREHDVLVGTITILLLFGPAAAGFTYCISFAFESPSYCSLFIIVFNFFIGQVGAIFSFAMDLINFECEIMGCDYKDSKFMLRAQQVLWVLHFIPSFSLGRSLFFVMQIDTISLLMRDKSISVWSPLIIGNDVIYLAIQAVLYIVLAIIIDHLSTMPRVVQVWNCFVHVHRQFFHLRSSSVDNEVFDEDVLDEAERVQSGEAIEDLIVLNNLTKQYSNGKVAVNRMSLGIPNGQCFGLLGVNGAGKTTTMQMLTAEFPPTSGDAILSQFSITNEPEETRRRVGYCPQFDAHFTNMTGREHVELYASIKGVPTAYVREAAAATLKEVGLKEYDSDRLSGGYSGGMKRKLSVACAMIGCPQIVILDEPSTGLDPVARRGLWKVISRMVLGSSSESSSVFERPSVILTTHSMEECEALCPRIGIMAAGNLRCLGSAQHLKTKFGKGFQVEMKVKEVSEHDDDFKKIIDMILSDDTNGWRDVENPSTYDNHFLKLNEVLEILEETTGDDSLSSMINKDAPIGYVVYRNATSESGISLSEFATFCVEELRMKQVIDFFTQTYGESSTLRERQNNKIRYELESEGLKISSLFASIEKEREKLSVAEYGVCQTSLEQIFNSFAAEDEEKKKDTVDF